MRLLFIIDETAFYHPDFLARFLERTGDTVVAVGIVTAIPPKNDIVRYMARHFYYLRPSELIRLVWRRISYAILDLLARRKRGGRFYSVRAVADFFGIDRFEIRNSVNSTACRNRIAGYRPDIIVSSNSLYFGKKLLGIPTLGCLNRHSGLLPSYGGLWSVLQAVRNGERVAGVTVHMMSPVIDQGAIIAQREVPIDAGDTVADVYEKCFTQSTDVVLEAVARVGKGDTASVQNSYSESYYSFPAKEHWNDLRRRGRRFI